MILLPDLSSVHCLSSYCVRYSYILFLLIPALLSLIWIVPRNFVKFQHKLDQKEYVASKKSIRRQVLLFRSLAFFFIIIALASPFELTDKLVQGNPRLTILMDNSTSMTLFESGYGERLFDELNGVIPVKLRTISTGLESPIGSGILNHAEGGESVLVITDGNNNGGKLLGDVMLFTSSINTTVSTLNLKPLSNDVGVFINGPYELIKDNEGEFEVVVNNVGEKTNYHITVVVDDEVIIDEDVQGSQSYPFTRKFSVAGSHKITARITNVGDYFPQNNVYYKSVKVVPRPRILFVSNQQSFLLGELERLYSVESQSFIPNNLDQYMAVILDNLPASQILPSFDGLSEYVENGNGLIVFGGDSAFESGGYKGTLFETLLPVTMGAGEEENKSDVNVVVVIDISAASKEEIPLEKALALSVLDSLHKTNNVGIVAFNTDAYEVEPILPLNAHDKEAREKISKLGFDGQSMFNIGLQGAYDLLKDVGGSKNIIFLSDGYTTYQKLRENTLSDARNIYARGVKIYTVGVGATRDNLFLDNIARLGGGIYFPADASNKLKVLFGEPDTSEEPDFYNSLLTLDSTHFITQGFEPSATISGYNYVVPKPSSRLLVSTNKNIPVVVVWRFGLGRVATIASDNGNRWAGELLNKRNSKLLTKTVNWGIGDLSRKKRFDVTIRDTTVDEPTLVHVVSDEQPESEGLLFAKVDTNFYSAEYRQGQPGYFTILGSTAAVNYAKEYANLGTSEEFTALVESTGGKIFNVEDTESILEFVKTKSRRIKIESKDWRWPFVLTGLLIFLLDVGLRRIRESEGK